MVRTIAERDHTRVLQLTTGPEAEVEVPTEANVRAGAQAEAGPRNVTTAWAEAEAGVRDGSTQVNAMETGPLVSDPLGENQLFFEVYDSEAGDVSLDKIGFEIPKSVIHWKRTTFCLKLMFWNR